MKEFVGPHDMIVPATDTSAFTPESFAQYAAKTTAYPLIDGPEGPFAGMFKIFKPAFKRAVHIRDCGFKTMAVASSRFAAYPVSEFRDALLSRISVFPVKSIAQKFEVRAALGKVNDPCLVRMQRQLSCFDQCVHQSKRGLRFFSASGR